MEKIVTYHGATYLVPEWVQHIAQDSDGEIYGYEFEPDPGFECWRNSGAGRFIKLHQSTVNWWESLVYL